MPKARVMTWVNRHRRGLLAYAVFEVWGVVLVELFHSQVAALIAWEASRI